VTNEDERVERNGYTVYLSIVCVLCHIDQPVKSVFISGVECLQTTRIARERTIVHNVRHSLYLSTITKVVHGQAPSLMVGSAVTLSSAETVTVIVTHPAITVLTAIAA
jgi:hypothetical protein